MYLFQISNYDDPAVDRETAELLRQRLEAESRRRCPAMWNAIGRIRTHATKGPAREKWTVRYRIYGVFLLALWAQPRSLQACWSLPLLAAASR